MPPLTRPTRLARLTHRDLRRTARRGLAAAALPALAVLGGCQALPPVKPWEKGVLARPEMKLDAARLEGSFTDHVYTSKEAGLPGRGVGAGGCGCN